MRPHRSTLANPTSLADRLPGLLLLGLAAPVGVATFNVACGNSTALITAVNTANANIEANT